MVDAKVYYEFKHQHLRKWVIRRQSKFADTTMKIYKYVISRFLIWCRAQDVHPLRVEYDTIDDYIQENFHDHANATIRTNLSGIHDFYMYLQWNLKLIPKNDINPIDHYRNTKPDDGHETIPYPKANLDDVRTIIFQAKSIQVRASTAILLECALRPKELLGIETEHVNLSDDPKTINIAHTQGKTTRQEQIIIMPWNIYIQFGKGKKGKHPRQVVLFGSIRKILKRYLIWRENQNPLDPQLFFNYQMRKLSIENLRINLLKACEELNITSGASKGYKRKNRVIGVNGIYTRQIRPLFRSEMSMRHMDEKSMNLQMGHKGGNVGEVKYNQRNNNERLQAHQAVGELISQTV